MQILLGSKSLLRIPLTSLILPPIKLLILLVLLNPSTLRDLLLETNTLQNSNSDNKSSSPSSLRVTQTIRIA